jgi:hypothetical protein
MKRSFIGIAITALVISSVLGMSSLPRIREDLQILEQDLAQ